MSTDRETTRIVRSWMEEGVTQLPDRVLDSVLDQLPTTQQRRATRWPAWRYATMNTFAKAGLAAAAVVVALLIGAQLIGSLDGGVGADPIATATPEPTPEPTPSPSAWAGIPAGPFVVTSADDPVQVTFDIASSDWSPFPDFDGVLKNDDGMDAPQTISGLLVTWAWPAGTAFNVYGDPCQWSTTTPETPATTAEEIAAGLAAQAQSGATAPIDVTVGGYAGKAITLTVPMSYEVPGATREEQFADCDESIYGFYGIEGVGEPERNAQGPGQVDELWILDVDGWIVILDATYGPAAPAGLVEEMRALVESATFEVP